MLNIAHKDKMVKLCNRLVYLFSIVFLMVTDFPKHTVRGHSTHMTPTEPSTLSDSK